MSVEGIRKVDVSEGWAPSGDLGSESISVRSWESEEVPALISGYPFEGQRVVNARFDYEPSSGFGAVNQAEGKIQLRTESGLLVVGSEEESTDIHNVVEELSQVVNGDVNIERRFVPERRRIWDFLSHGTPVRVDVITPFSGVERVSFESAENSRGISLEEARGDYPVDFAEMKFAQDGEEFTVVYENDKIRISSTEDDHVEYVIQVFETAMFS